MLTAGFKYAYSRKTVVSGCYLYSTPSDWLMLFECRMFRQALEEIFAMSDADANGSLSRAEFDAYMLRSDGQHVSDEDWSVLQTLDTVRKTPAGNMLLSKQLHY